MLKSYNSCILYSLLHGAYFGRYLTQIDFVGINTYIRRFQSYFIYFNKVQSHRSYFPDVDDGPFLNLFNVDFSSHHYPTIFQTSITKLSSTIFLPIMNLCSSQQQRTTQVRTFSFFKCTKWRNAAIRFLKSLLVSIPLADCWIIL